MAVIKIEKEITKRFVFSVAKVRDYLRQPLLLILSIATATAFISGCASTNAKVDKSTGMGIPREVQIPKEASKVEALPPSEPVKTPDYVTVVDEMSPLKSRIVDIAARNTPLRDVLFIISEAINVNLAIEKDVDPDVPVTVTLRRVTAEDALNTIFTTLDYFYTVKNNMLIVKATETKTFELGHPAFTQTYSTDLGGDMLGASSFGTATGNTGSTGSTGSSGGTSNIKGSITQKSESDKTAYNFWEVIEKSIEKMLASQDRKTGNPTSIAQPQVPGGVATPSVSQMTAPVNQGLAINRMTGTIIVTATRKNMEKVEQYLDVIKKVINRQVLIEAKIIEVKLSDGLNLGIDWTFLATLNQRQAISLGTQNFASAAVSASSPAFVATATGGDFSSLLKALQTQGETRILSNPRLNIMNGQTSILGVGQSQSYISRVQSTTTSAAITPLTTYTVETSSTVSGLMLGLIPFISEKGEISLTITPIISSLRELTPKTIGGGASGSVEMMLPTVDVREMSTTVKVLNGQLIVIGGLIAKTESLQDSQIPFLGSIPVLGYLFKSRVKKVENTELVVIIQPLIVSR